MSVKCMGVLSSIKLCISNMGDACLDVGALMLTQDSAEILVKIFWIINEVVWVVLEYIYDTLVHCS